MSAVFLFRELPLLGQCMFTIIGLGIFGGRVELVCSGFSPDILVITSLTRSRADNAKRSRVGRAEKRLSLFQHQYSSPIRVMSQLLAQS
jgi:hypothetical protein